MPLVFSSYSAAARKGCFCPRSRFSPAYPAPWRSLVALFGEQPSRVFLSSRRLLAFLCSFLQAVQCLFFYIFICYFIYTFIIFYIATLYFIFLLFTFRKFLVISFSISVCSCLYLSLTYSKMSGASLTYLHQPKADASAPRSALSCRVFFGWCQPQALPPRGSGGLGEGATCGPSPPISAVQLLVVPGCVPGTISGCDA